jgi:hypothetical protein
MMPTTSKLGAPEFARSVRVELSNATQTFHWITVTNLINAAVNFEGRYAIL